MVITLKAFPSDSSDVLDGVVNISDEPSSNKSDSDELGELSEEDLLLALLLPEFCMYS